MNTKAWAEFEHKLRTYVGRRVNQNAVDDVVSDILLRLVRSQDKMEGAKNPLAWVYRVAANVITDHYRKSASDKRLVGAVLHEPADIDDENAEDQSLARCLVPMIKSLPAPYDQALLLTDINGLSQVDAANQLGLTVSGMKSRVQRGRQKLKSSLLNCCDIEVNRRGDIIDYQSRKTDAGCQNSC
jgi:RNA polymerase sigma-70 factor (ECF subfamily)